MDEQIYWFITVFEKAEIDNLGWPKTGSTRCWGFYKNKEDALNTLHKSKALDSRRCTFSSQGKSSHTSTTISPT